MKQRVFYLKNNANVSYVDSKYEALKDANTVILVTEWQEFRTVDFDERKTVEVTTLF